MEILMGFRHTERAFVMAKRALNMYFSDYKGCYAPLPVWIHRRVQEACLLRDVLRELKCEHQYQYNPRSGGFWVCGICGDLKRSA